jgi:hypothetical protein
MMRAYISLGINDDEAAEKAFAEAYTKLLDHLPEAYRTGDEPATATIPLYAALDTATH